MIVGAFPKRAQNIYIYIYIDIDIDVDIYISLSMESQRKLLILILRHLLLCIDTSTSLPDKDTRIYFHRRIEFFSKRARTRLPVFSPSIYVCMHRYFCTLLPIRIHKHIHTCTHVEAHKHACAHIERNTCAERKRERERCQCD